ncbi:MAG: hypothetical protein DMF44_14305 [Verrucomicrobia bacterium]|nr:MAG: hypothetical protein DMF44_14305 [Verrucomicrobiota bacterium]
MKPVNVNRGLIRFFGKCNSQSEIYTLTSFTGVLARVGRARQWHQCPVDFLKLFRLDLTCSTLGKSTKSLHLTYAQIMAKFVMTG